MTGNDTQIQKFSKSKIVFPWGTFVKARHCPSYPPAHAGEIGDGGQRCRGFLFPRMKKTILERSFETWVF